MRDIIQKQLLFISAFYEIINVAFRKFAGRLKRNISTDIQDVKNIIGNTRKSCLVKFHYNFYGYSYQFLINERMSKF